MTHKNTSVQCVGDLSKLKSPLSTEIDASLMLVAFYMNIMNVEAAGVVNEQNHCIGFVTSDDVVNHVCDRQQEQNDPCIADVMRPPNMCVYLSDPIEKALITMNLHAIDWLPVIDFKTRKFSGLICREDIAPFPSNIIPFLKRKLFTENHADTKKREIL